MQKTLIVVFSLFLAFQASANEQTSKSDVLVKEAKNKEVILKSLSDMSEKFKPLEAEHLWIVFFDSNKKYDFPQKMAIYEKRESGYLLVFESATPFSEDMCFTEMGCESKAKMNKDILIMEMIDKSDDQMDITYKFRFENSDLRLVGKTVSVQPKISMTNDDGESMQGRVKCEEDSNLVNGLRIRKKSSRKLADGTKANEKELTPNYLKKNAISFQPTYLEEFCK